MSTNFNELVDCPDKGSINTKNKSCPTAELIAKFGPPRQVLTDDCQPITSPYWRKAMGTENVGPFRATGHKLALELFRQAFADVKAQNPDLYAVLGSAGMLCCRRVRGSKRTLSNHGLGMALDITIGGKLDSRGDNKVQRGLLELYSILKNHGIFWGAGFATEAPVCSARSTMRASIRS